MQKQRRCYNHLQAPTRLIQSTAKGINQLRKRTLGRISLLTLSLLTYLVGSSLIKAKLVKKTRITKEILGALRDKDRVIAIALLQWVLMPTLLKKKRKTSSKSSIITIIRTIITLISTLKI